MLKGSVVFLADLVRAIDIPLELDFMAVSSYGAGVKTSGVVRIIKDLDKPIEGYDILIVEDILDSGMTLSYLVEMLKDRVSRMQAGSCKVKAGESLAREHGQHVSVDPGRRCFLCSPMLYSQQIYVRFVRFSTLPAVFKAWRNNLQAASLPLCGAICSRAVSGVMGTLPPSYKEAPCGMFFPLAADAKVLFYTLG